MKLLRASQIREVIDRVQRGEPRQDVADDMGVSVKTIRDWVRDPDSRATLQNDWEWIADNMPPRQANEYLKHIIETNFSHMTDAPHPMDGYATRPQVRQMLKILHDRSPSVVSFEAMMEALFAHQQDECSKSSLKVQICRARRSLRGSAWRIDSVWGVGWRMVAQAAEQDG